MKELRSKVWALLTAKSVKTTIAMLLVLLVSAELTLQVRAEVKSGNSIFSAVQGQFEEGSGFYVEKEGYRLLSPEKETASGDLLIISNSRGFRDEEPDSSRHEIVILGASTVYGAYAQTNDLTFPNLLERMLEADNPNISVLNAGIPGNNIDGQYNLFANELDETQIDQLIVYPGLTNMVASACSDKPPTNWSLPKPELPDWLLMVDLLLKNTTEARHVPANEVIETEVDIEPIRSQLDRGLTRLVEAALEQGVRQILLVENVKAFNRNQPVDQQRKLAETTLYYASCFSLDGIHDSFEQLNSVMRTVANDYGKVRYVDFPGSSFDDPALFHDSIHFTYAGEELMASRLREEIQGLVLGRSE